MNVICWRMGDLAYCQGLLCEVIDAGMGKPRGNMHLRTVDGARDFTDVGEEHIRRPEIDVGSWVRSGKSPWLYRVRGVWSDYLDFDLRWYLSGEPSYVPCRAVAATCVRVRPPNTSRARAEPPVEKEMRPLAKSKINWVQKDGEIFGRCEVLLKLCELSDAKAFSKASWGIFRDFANDRRHICEVCS